MASLRIELPTWVLYILAVTRPPYHNHKRKMGNCFEFRALKKKKGWVKIGLGLDSIREQSQLPCGSAVHPGRFRISPGIFSLVINTVHQRINIAESGTSPQDCKY